tara:strand:+ start:456 stop:914 length:459 start_codon:yes stop_codon:yes gene_type:complete
MKIIPFTLRKANEFVRIHHRHSKTVVGCKFSIAAVDESGTVIGVAIVGRPVARRLDDGLTGEIVRTCTNGGKNINSFLYGACARIWKEMGGKRILTYTLSTESGSSLKAAGYTHTSITQPFKEGTGWTTRKNREWQPKVHSLPKLRWERIWI